MTDVSPELLSALRRLMYEKAAKVVPTTDNRVYWHVYCGAFDTFIDPRDASTLDEALNAAINFLQPWYVRKISFAETPTVEAESRDKYLEWLKRGVK